MENKRNVLKIEIKGGKFVGTRGAEVTEFRPDFVHGDGWRCKLYEDGSIRCKKIIDNTHTISLKISRYGYATLAQISNGERKELRKYKLRRWPRDGIITLMTGENVEKTYAYFQDEDYLKFLTTQNIFAIKSQDPNCTYTIYKCLSVETGKDVKEEILTDGRVIEIGKNFGKTSQWEKQYPGTYSFEEYRVLKVVDATWVIISREEIWKRTKRILYTLVDFHEIEHLPSSNNI